MKKKGLIISTIVMVVVLIASLTTATYAWFTTSSATSVEGVNISAAAGADVKIGVLANSLAYDSSATQDSFISGTVSGKSTYNGFEGGEPGLGSNLATGLQLDQIAKATGMGTVNTLSYTESADGTYYKKSTSDEYVLVTAYESLDADEKALYDTSKKYSASGTAGSASKLDPSALVGTIVKAAGVTTKNAGGTITGSEITPSSVEAAIANGTGEIKGDYLHFTIGLAASVTGIQKIKLTLFVNPTDSKATLGITTALHFDYKVDNGTWTTGNDGDIYGDKHYNTLKTANGVNTGTNVGAALTAAGTSGGYPEVTDNTQLSAGWEKVEIELTPNNSSEFEVNTEIHQIEFFIYYDGTDSDCLTEALGSTCQVMFMVTNKKAA